MSHFSKTALVALVLLSLTAVSCKKTHTDDSTVYGTWQMRYDSQHYFDATFNEDGTYEWIWYGAQGMLKDTGGYSRVGSVIKMNPERYWMDDWNGGLVEVSAEEYDYTGYRMVTFVEHLGSMAYWKWENCNVFSTSDEFGVDKMPVFRKGAKTANFKGTWVGDAYTSDKEMWEFTAYGFSKYEIDLPYNDWPLRITRRQGTWTNDGNAVTLNFTKLERSRKDVGDGKYDYYTVDPDTYETQYGESKDLDYTETTYIFTYGSQMFMENLVLTKK